MRVKIFGERNTGTHLLRKLLKENFNVDLVPDEPPGYYTATKDWPHPKKASQAVKQMLVDDQHARTEGIYGWKHGCPWKVPPDVFVITISKHPANWLKSLYKKPYERVLTAGEQTFSEFIRFPWYAHRREHTKFTIYPTPLHLYFEKMQSYIGVTKHHIVYEEFIKDMRKGLEALSFGRLRPDLIIPKISAKSGSMSTEDIIAKYAKGPYHGVSTEDRLFIIDTWKLLQELHKAKVTP